jgi:4-amino-4-deoxy-L-arabinose transferase-like glycosyltransferase
MMTASERERSTIPARWSPWLLVGTLLLFHAVNNWIWLVKNVTWTGWDKARHLAQSLAYFHQFGQFSLQSLFAVMVGDPIRPPLFAASASLPYALFGRTADVATMVNVIYMAIALGATYGIGRRWGGTRLGLAATVLLAFLPMFYAMSRYFYLEFALTAMVALTVYLLLATEGFQKRKVSLAFGLSLGLGLLTKRTFAVFAVGPLVVAVLNAGLLPIAWERLKRRPRLYLGKLALALVGGLALALLWYLPNRETVQTLILGDALLFIWWALASLAIYFVALPAAPLSNAVAASAVGAGLASTWYLARIEFLERVALYGYGIDDPRGRALRLDRLDTYLYYIRKLATEHLSVLIFLAFAAILAIATITILHRARSARTLLGSLKPEAWTILAWIGGAYLLLTFSIYDESRAFTPALPAVALLAGAALWRLPWRRVRVAALGLLLGFGLFQFFALTYEPVHRVIPSRTISLPLLGPTSLLAQGPYIQLPDEGQTDRGYWVQPDVLAAVEQRRQQLERDVLSLGLFVNTTQLNFGSFNYLVLTGHPQLRVESPIAELEEGTIYRHLFSHDYVLVGPMDEGMTQPREELVRDLTDNPASLFSQTYELETSYHLPRGDTVYLYRQRYPLPAGYPAEYVTRLAEQMSQQTAAGDAILLTPPQLVYAFLSEFTAPAQVYLEPETAEELGTIAVGHRRVFLVMGDAAAGQGQGLGREWLNRHAFFARHQWADSLQVLTYGTVEGEPATTPGEELGAVFGGQVELVGFDLPPTTWQAGQVVPLSLFWQQREAIDSDYGVFVHLVDESGQLVAQTDSPPVGGSRPTSSWQPGEMIVDRHGLPLPGELGGGHYELRVGLVDPSTAERLPLRDAQGQVLDSVAIVTLEVE